MNKLMQIQRADDKKNIIHIAPQLRLLIISYEYSDGLPPFLFDLFALKYIKNDDGWDDDDDDDDDEEEEEEKDDDDDSDNQEDNHDIYIVRSTWERSTLSLG